MKPVAYFREPYNAHIARGLLISEGVPAIVEDEYLVQANWTLSQAVGGVKLMVPDDCLEDARGILSDDYREKLTPMREQGAAGKDEVCPVCGSDEITQNGYSPFSLIPSILLQLPLFIRRKKWRCRICDAIW